MKLNKTKHMRNLEEMNKELKLGDYTVYSVFCAMMRQHQDVIERVKDLTLVLPHGKKFVPAPGIKTDNRDEVLFHFSETFPEKVDALAAMRLFQPTYAENAEKSSYMSGDVPVTKYTYKLALDDRTFEFSYTKEGLPTPNCKVIEHSYKTIVCEVPEAAPVEPIAPGPTDDFEQI